MVFIANANVNGLRGSLLTGKGASLGFGLDCWLKNRPNLGVLAIQETRIAKTDSAFSKCLEKLGISEDDFFLQDDLIKKGHGGVALLINPELVDVEEIRTPFETHPEASLYNYSGRWIEADITDKESKKKLTVASCYLHHADSPTLKNRDGILIDREKSEISMENKHRFLSRVTEHLQNAQEIESKTKRSFIMTGDFNIAHSNYDIKNFAGNQTKAGFLPEERAWLDLWTHSKNLEDVKKTYSYNELIDYTPPKTDVFDNGFLNFKDICREFWGKEERIYTWWTNMGRAFDNDAGWRIDYQFTSKGITLENINSATVDKQESYSTRFSDHAPVVVEYSF